MSEYVIHIYKQNLKRIAFSCKKYLKCVQKNVYMKVEMSNKPFLNKLFNRLHYCIALCLCGKLPKTKLTNKQVAKNKYNNAIFLIVTIVVQ